ncbi:Gametocyte-specific factor 1 homolog [Gryllus bimaculatus]|nr:Gametocyte-specific factor 1 homolog [Gryllus bimaculatus]
MRSVLACRKLQVTRPKAGKEWKRFLVMSAVAWGLPSLMTGLCAYAFERDQLLRKWSSPSLTETRTCFNEIILTTRQDVRLVKLLAHKRHRYGRSPVCVREWILSTPDVANAFSHTPHANGRSPVCVRSCLVARSLLANARAQKPHANGRSPVCERRCSLVATPSRNDRGTASPRIHYAEKQLHQNLGEMAEHWNSETVAQCPYNPSHLVPRMRFPNHLVKCQKNYPHVVLKICPYNATHRIKAEAYLQHLVNCPNRQHYRIGMLKFTSNAILTQNPLSKAEITTSTANRCNNENRRILFETRTHHLLSVTKVTKSSGRCCDPEPSPASEWQHGVPSGGTALFALVSAVSVLL